jgi:hypothetical protein
MYRQRRVFCATSWELEGERRIFYDAIGAFNESAAMPRGLLYIPVSLQNIRDKRPYQYDLDQNIRACRHYLLALAGDWGPLERNFESDYRLALDCARDPALPMRDVTLFLRRSSGGEPHSFLANLASAGIVPIVFKDIPDFCGHVTRLLSGWIEEDASDA